MLLMKRTTKLECLSLKSLSSRVQYLLIRLEPAWAGHLSGFPAWIGSWPWPQILGKVGKTFQAKHPRVFGTKLHNIETWAQCYKTFCQ